MALNTDTRKSLFPDAVYIPAQDAINDALALTLAQQGPAIEGDAPSVRVPLCADMEAAQVAEGATITETEAALSEIEIHTRKLALLTRMSYEAYSHSDATNLLTDTMRRSITNAADKAFLTNAKGEDGTPAGITNTEGIVKPEDSITDSLAPLLEAIGEVAWRRPISCVARIRRLGETHADQGQRRKSDFQSDSYRRHRHKRVRHPIRAL